MKSKKILIMILIIFIIMFLFSSDVYIYYHYNKDNDNKDNKIVENVDNADKAVVKERKKLSVENEQWLDKYPNIKNVYNIMHQKPVLYQKDDIVYKEYYSKDVTINKDLSDEMKATLAITYEYNYEKVNEASQDESIPYYSVSGQNLDQCIASDTHSDLIYKLGCGEAVLITYTLEKNQIDSLINNSFGEDNDYIDTNVNMGSCKLELIFNQQTNKYKLYSGGLCTGINYPIYGYYSKIINIEKKDDEINLYEKVFSTFLDLSSTIYIVNVYDVDGKTIIGNDSYSDDFTIEETDKVLYEYFEKYNDKLKEYKYTYKQREDGSYYFYSMELIK